MKLVAMLRIKNQILTIRECLSRLSELVDEIVIVDNGSDDGTLDIYKKFSKIVKVKHTKGFNEGRDKCLALDLAKKRNPDWILWIDGDEIFEKSLNRKVLNKYMFNRNVNLVQFRMYNFWMNKERFRIDGKWLKYTALPQRQMWRNLPNAYFRNIPFHNGGIQNVPPKHIVSLFRLKHYGYINKKQINIKNKVYKKLYNDNMSVKTMNTDEYRKKTLKWIEFENKILNYCWQKMEYTIWNSIVYFLFVKDKLKLLF